MNTTKVSTAALFPGDVRTLLKAAELTGQNLYVDTLNRRSTHPARVIDARRVNGHTVLKVMHDDEEWAWDPIYLLYIQ